jgi:hypothetical protein
MIRYRVALVAAAAALAVPAAAQQRAQYGKETTIAYAGNGGIRNWETGPGNVVFLQDRTQRWYRVELTGPCGKRRGGSDTLIYDVGPSNRIDRFSRISNRRIPGAVCGVTSIRTSPPPPGQPGAPKAPRRH